MSRPSEDQINLEIARVAARRTTCARRGVGCVLVDRHGYVISVGRNGVEKGREHCNEGYPCPAHDAPSGTNLSGCEAIHAEINAIAHCSNPREVDTIYITVSPCGDCMKALLALPNARRLVYAETYARHADALTKWERAGRTHALIPIDDAHQIVMDLVSVYREATDDQIRGATERDSLSARIKFTTERAKQYVDRWSR